MNGYIVGAELDSTFDSAASLVKADWQGHREENKCWWCSYWAEIFPSTANEKFLFAVAFPQRDSLFISSLPIHKTSPNSKRWSNSPKWVSKSREKMWKALPSLSNGKRVATWPLMEVITIDNPLGRRLEQYLNRNRFDRFIFCSSR